MTAGLVPWLRAQLDADQKSAAQWHDLECDIHDHLDGDIHKAIAASRMLTEVPGVVCDCGGPARVLRDVAFKRAILDDYVETCRLRDASAEAVRAAGDNRDPEQVAEEKWNHIEADALRDVLQHLAAVYADRDGYKEDWKP